MTLVKLAQSEDV